MRPALFFTHGFNKLLVDKFESFRRGCNVNTVAKSINLITHTRNYLAPRRSGFFLRQNVQFIHQRITNFETDDRLWLLHRSADSGSPILASVIKVNLFISLINFYVQSPVSSNFFHCRVKISRIWGYVGAKYPDLYWMLPNPLAYAATPNPCFARAKTSNIGFKFMGH